MQIHYDQDALNCRVAKEVNGTIVEKYLCEDLTTLLALYDEDDRLVWQFEYAVQRMPVAIRIICTTTKSAVYAPSATPTALSSKQSLTIRSVIYICLYVMCTGMEYIASISRRWS